MPYEIRTASIQGIEAVLVSCQIDSSPGIHAFSIVGLGDKAVQESQDRMNAAVRHCGFKAPRSQNRRYTLNLAPADLRKEGASFDLPIAIAYLLESRQIPDRSRETLFFGELALDGSLAPTNGVVAATLLARERGMREVVVPFANAREAAFVDSIHVIGAKSLKDVLTHITGERIMEPAKHSSESPARAPDDFAHIVGQETAKRALVVAAAGSHNIFMKGPPGSGKTLLARSITSILPPLTGEEALEIAKIYSSVGLLRTSPGSLTRPFRSPHHTASPVSIVGGGAWPRPGEVSLAHRGVLFLDEFAEFPRNVLESLRQPLEDGVVTISRASGSITLPARFLLVASMNPCPCGNHGDPRLPCSCSPQQVVRYRKKVSGPLLDRMDIQVTVSREPVTEREDPRPSDLMSIRETIAQAMTAQYERLRRGGIFANAHISHKNIDATCSVTPQARSLLVAAINSKNLSYRTYHRTLKVARTIADLTRDQEVLEHHVAEALSLRIDALGE